MYRIQFRAEWTILAGAALLALLPLIIGCGEDSVNAPGKSIPDNRTLTREGCIDRIVESFRDCDIDKYRSALLPPDTNSVFDAGYFWRNQQEDLIDTTVPELWFDYHEDLAATESLFVHADSIDMDIYQSAWDSLVLFRSKSCSDCWQTYRGYEIDVRLDHYHHYFGYFYLRIVVGPDPDHEGSYLIYQAEDLRRLVSLSEKKQGPGTNQASLGALKSIYLDIRE
jgi:hypothetical protein